MSNIIKTTFAAAMLIVLTAALAGCGTTEPPPTTPPANIIEQATAKPTSIIEQATAPPDNIPAEGAATSILIQTTAAAPKNHTTTKPTAQPTHSQAKKDPTTPTPEENRLTQAAHRAALQYLGADDSQGDTVTLQVWEKTQWGNGAMGCPHPGQDYTDAMVPGFIAIFHHQGSIVRVHLDQDARRVFVANDCPTGTDEIHLKPGKRPQQPTESRPCNDQMGFGRVARDSNNCVILDTMVVIAAPEYSLNEVADEINKLQGWTATARLEALRMVTARRHQDDLSLNQFKEELERVSRMPWAKEALYDSVSYVVPKK